MKQLWVRTVVDMNTIVRQDCGLDFVRPNVTGPKFPIGRTDNCIHKRC